MITITLLTIALLLVIITVIAFIICSPVAILTLLCLLLDIAVIGGIFRRKGGKK